MKKRFIVTIISFFLVAQTIAQQLPLGTCGIVCVYDAAGNRTKRVYFCNNGIDPYPTVAQKAPVNETTEYQYVDALYPNPTTGKFIITFSKSLQEAVVSIIDNNGKTLNRVKASGFEVSFDLSPYAAGMYYVRIEEKGKAIMKKVIKQ